jgi:hypothetical protein
MDTSLPYHIIIDSIPNNSISWIELFSSLLTPVIAFLAVYIAYQQYSVNRRRFLFEVYERRLAVYKSIQAFFDEFVKEGNITDESCREFAFITADVVFIFDKIVQNKIEEIHKNSIDLAGLDYELHPRGGSSKLLSDQERDEIAKKITEQSKWLLNQRDIIKELFQKKMSLK